MERIGRGRRTTSSGLLQLCTDGRACVGGGPKQRWPRLLGSLLSLSPLLPLLLPACVYTAASTPPWMRRGSPGARGGGGWGGGGGGGGESGEGSRERSGKNWGTIPPPVRFPITILISPPHTLHHPVRFPIMILISPTLTHSPTLHHPLCRFSTAAMPSPPLVPSLCGRPPHHPSSPLQVQHSRNAAVVWKAKAAGFLGRGRALSGAGGRTGGGGG